MVDHEYGAVAAMISDFRSHSDENSEIITAARRGSPEGPFLANTT